jgi:hypothetical protein
MNDASTIIEQKIQEGNVPPIQTNTPMEGGSVNIGEQSIVQGALAFMQELLTTDSNYNEFKCQTTKKSNMIPQIHPSNSAQNTLKKHKKVHNSF